MHPSAAVFLVDEMFGGFGHSSSVNCLCSANPLRKQIRSVVLGGFGVDGISTEPAQNHRTDLLFEWICFLSGFASKRLLQFPSCILSRWIRALLLPSFLPFLCASATIHRTRPKPPNGFAFRADLLPNACCSFYHVFFQDGSGRFCFLSFLPFFVHPRRPSRMRHRSVVLAIHGPLPGGCFLRKHPHASPGYAKYRVGARKSVLKHIFGIKDPSPAFSWGPIRPGSVFLPRMGCPFVS